MKILKQKKTDKLIVVSIDGQHCRLNYFSTLSDKPVVTATTSFNYSNEESLEKAINHWLRTNGYKNILCRWLLNRELYQTYNIDAPNVLEKEMAEAIKWQIKDLLDFPVNDILVSYYKPKPPTADSKQIVAVVVEKKLIESLISISQKVNLIMDAIEIEELSIGYALLPQLVENQITGYVGEDSTGLVFNFYSGEELAFTRHKKGRFLPVSSTDEFSLESENQDKEDAFLLEMQRTLDYVVGQLFRRPVDKLLLQGASDSDQSLADTVSQLTEIEVCLVSPEISLAQDNSDKNSLPYLSELGSALRGGG